MHAGRWSSAAGGGKSSEQTAGGGASKRVGVASLSGVDLSNIAGVVVIDNFVDEDKALQMALDVSDGFEEVHTAT